MEVKPCQYKYICQQQSIEDCPKWKHLIGDSIWVEPKASWIPSCTVNSIWSILVNRGNLVERRLLDLSILNNWSKRINMTIYTQINIKSVTTRNNCCTVGVPISYNFCAVPEYSHMNKMFQYTFMFSIRSVCCYIWIIFFIIGDCYKVKLVCNK